MYAGGSTKNFYIYQLFDMKGNLIREGSSNEIADFIQVSPNNIYISCITKGVILGEYRVSRKPKSLVGNSYMTMMKDVEVHGENTQIDVSIEKMNLLAKELKKYKKSKNNNKNLINCLVDVSIMMDEIRLFVKNDDNFRITDQNLKELKYEKLKLIAKELEK